MSVIQLGVIEFGHPPIDFTHHKAQGAYLSLSMKEGCLFVCFVCFVCHVEVSCIAMFLDTVLGTIGNQGSMSKGAHRVGAHRVGFCRIF